jgi:isopentenyl diphosphate isomerase/L-lactate dehydrogenase-like FMN-dependent dehydrogenase
MRRVARKKLPRLVFDFVDGGAEDELALRRNEAAFADTMFLPRPLNGTTTRDQSVELFGERLRGPVLIGPTGLAGMLGPRGEAESARAAAAAGTVYTMSHGSMVSIEDLAPEAMEISGCRSSYYRRADAHPAARAHSAGLALVLTIGNQVLVGASATRRNGLPIRRNGGLELFDMAWHAGWLLRGPRAQFTPIN